MQSLNNLRLIVRNFPCRSREGHKLFSHLDKISYHPLQSDILLKYGKCVTEVEPRYPFFFRDWDSKCDLDLDAVLAYCPNIEKTILDARDAKPLYDHAEFAEKPEEWWLTSCEAHKVIIDC